MWWIGVLIFGGAAAGMAFLAKGATARRDVMESMKTERIGSLGARSGYVEVKGRASCEEPLVIPHVNRKCVYYSYSIEREEFDRDSEGRERRRWRTIERRDEGTEFTLTDRTGSIEVDPSGAETDAPQLYRGELPSDLDAGANADGIMGMLGSFAGKAIDRAVNGRQRITVVGIEEGADLYVLATVRAKGDDLSLGRGRSKEDRFFISTKSEAELKSQYGNRGMIFWIIGGVALLIALFCMAKGAGM